MSEQEARCPDCGRWYEVYSMYVGLQTCCPSCRAKREAEKRETRKGNGLGFQSQP